MVRHEDTGSKKPPWMMDMFEELKSMFEGLFSHTDKFNLEEMQRRLDEQAGLNTRLPLQQC